MPSPFKLLAELAHEYETTGDLNGQRSKRQVARDKLIIEALRNGATMRAIHSATGLEMVQIARLRDRNDNAA